MNWDAISAIAELVGALAIVISLIYVGIQVNENSHEVRSATAQQATSAIADWYTSLGNNQQASRLFHLGMVNPEELSSEDLAQFIYLGHGLMLEYQAVYYVAREGTLDKALQESITKTLVAVAHQPGFLFFWQQRRELFYPEYRAHIDGIIAIGPDPSLSALQNLYDRSGTW